MAVLRYEYDKYFKRPWKTRYLAVGSSQTGAIYRPYAKKRRNIKVFTLSGAGPLDLILYRNYIRSFNPGYILLYLSEFDLARGVGLKSAVIAPRQGFYLFQLLPMLRDAAKHAHLEISLKEMIAGEICPEYKYSFIFKAILNKLLKKKKALGVQEVTKIQDSDYLKIHLKNTEKNLQKGNIEFNVRFLRRFLSYCRDESLQVIIVEGQYNPLAYTEKNLALHQITHERLIAIDNEFENVAVIPRSAVMELKAGDYRDGYHLKPSVAYAFVTKLMAVIDETISKKSGTH